MTQAMNRRHFLRTTGVVGAATLGAPWVARAQGNEIQRSLSQTGKMFGRVEVRDPISTDDLPPFLVRQFKSMFMIDGLPHLIFGRFRIEDQPIEVEDKSFDHSRQIIPERGHAILCASQPE